MSDPGANLSGFAPLDRMSAGRCPSRRRDVEWSDASIFWPLDDRPGHRLCAGPGAGPLLEPPTSAGGAQVGEDDARGIAAGRAGDPGAREGPGAAEEEAGQVGAIAGEFALAATDECRKRSAGVGRRITSHHAE